MGKVIGIVNKKGGVGKTTTATTLSYLLTKKGYKVALIDFDGQRHSTLLSGVLCPEQLPLTIYDLLKKLVMDEPLPEAGEYVIQTENGVHLIPANEKLDNFEKLMSDATFCEYKLKEFVDTIRDSYDYIIIDCIYYFCRYVNQLGISSCSHGLIYEKEIEEIVMEAINSQILQAMELKAFYSKKAELNKREQMKKRQVEKKMLDRIASLKSQSMKLYEQYQEGNISREQFMFTKEQLNIQKRQLEEQVVSENQTEEAAQENKYLKIFGDREPITELTRELTELMVERINIFNHKRIQVIFKFADEYKKAVFEKAEYR